MKLAILLMAAAVMAAACTTATENTPVDKTEVPATSQTQDSEEISPESEPGWSSVTSGLVPDAYPPEPVLYKGVEINWRDSRGECPEGLNCQPCWWPVPDRITGSDGKVEYLTPIGCRPHSYTASGDESLRDIADRYDSDSRHEVLCVEEEWQDRPDEILPAGTIVSFC